MKYPFDRHTCTISMRIGNTGQTKINIIEEKPKSIFIGNKKVKQFDIIDVTSNASTYMYQQDFFSNSSKTQEEERQTYNVNIHLQRDSKDLVLTTFGPTVLFWFLAYLTLFFDTDDISNRSRTSVTVLLVVVSLLSSVKTDFPKTTYFKYIDLWFFWFVMNIFIIISLHIILENVDIPVSNQQSIKSNKVTPMSIQKGQGSNLSALVRNEEQDLKSGRMNCKMIISMDTINIVFKLVLPIATSIFIIVYFKWSMAE